MASFTELRAHRKRRVRKEIMNSVQKMLTLRYKADIQLEILVGICAEDIDLEVIFSEKTVEAKGLD